MKIWTCGNSPLSGSRNVWTRNKNVNGATLLRKFCYFSGAIRVIPCGDLWPWTKPVYAMIRRQRKKCVEWQHSRSLRHKISEYKNTLKNSRLSSLGSRRHPPQWLASKGPNSQLRVLSISGGAIEGYFEGKSPQEINQVCLVLARQCSGIPGTCNPEDSGLPTHPMSWSLTLFSGSGPVGLPHVPWTEIHLKIRHFSPTRMSLLPRKPAWKYSFFLSALHKWAQRAKKCISLRGDYID